MYGTRPGIHAIRYVISELLHRGSVFTVILLFVDLFAGAVRLDAQNVIFLEHGKIEFEKKVNLYADLDEDDSWSEVEKRAMPKFKSTYFDLLFSGEKTLYRPGRENTDNNKLYGLKVAQDNVVFSQLDSSKSISQKNVFEELFLVKDSTRRIQWKITDESRVVAGFSCRRANAIVMDSVYVVAFYTDDIITPGGPESFNGLPGMILGVSLPHQHMSWFATRVENTEVSAADLRIPGKGKKISNAELKAMLKDRMKDWGKFAQRSMEAVML